MMTCSTGIVSALRIVPQARAALRLALLVSFAWSSPAAAQETLPYPTIGPPVAFEETLQAVLVELRAVRAWLERSNGPASSHVLAVGQQLHAHEVRAAGTARRLDDVRMGLAEAQATRTAQTELLADLKRVLGAEAPAAERRAFQLEMARTRANVKRAQLLETRFEQQEGEIAAELEEASRQVHALSERLRALAQPQRAGPAK